MQSYNDPDGGQQCHCVNVDECTDQTLAYQHSCVSSTCADTDGDFDCDCYSTGNWVQIDSRRCGPDAGYLVNPNDPTNTIDIDECSEDPTEAAHPPDSNFAHTCTDGAICSNSPGSFTCICPVGQSETSDGGCEDTNECLAGTHDCATVELCQDIPGGWKCSCAAGYTDTRATSADPINCVDFDECASAVGMVQRQCDANAQCANTDGSFTCECNCEQGQTCYGSLSIFPDGHPHSGVAVDHPGQICVEVNYASCSDNNGVGPCDPATDENSVTVGQCTTIVQAGGAAGASCSCSPNTAYRMLDADTGKCLSGEMSQQCGVATSGSTATIGCDIGKIKGIKFASWGRPIGTCGKFTVDATCHRDVRDKVSASCIGQTSCTINARETDLGGWSDSTCSDGASRLYIEAECDCDGGIEDEDSGVPNGKCRCPCQDADDIFLLKLKVSAKILHFTKKFRTSSSVWSQAHSRMRCSCHLGPHRTCPSLGCRSPNPTPMSHTHVPRTSAPTSAVDNTRG